ncbi:sulfur carrier protein ThiS [Anaerobacillus sp. MEB173]|uniref:sulfur carrier protein ThiS n=1 Tax=Anaerobacillus sp. MEB173 TaxID=3383345 RepID=UPI003F8F5D5C
MNIIVNGEKKQIDVKTLEDVVKHFGLEKNLVVTEVNGEIIERDQWTTTEVTEGMKIELVHFVGGG